MVIEVWEAAKMARSVMFRLVPAMGLEKWYLRVLLNQSRHLVPVGAVPQPLFPGHMLFRPEGRRPKAQRNTWSLGYSSDGRRTRP